MVIKLEEKLNNPEGERKRWEAVFDKNLKI